MKSLLLVAFAILAPALSTPPATTPPATAQAVNFVDPVIEAIDVRDVSPEVRQQILDRLGVRVGEVLTVEAKHRIGREIGQVQKGLGFSYRASSRPGVVTVRIEPC